MILGLIFEQKSSFADQMSDQKFELEKVILGKIKHVDSGDLESVVKGPPFLTKEKVVYKSYSLDLQFRASNS